jgi:hypothetical protein
MGETTQGLEIKQTIREIRELSESMIETPEEERILVYRQLNRHFLTLEGFVTTKPDGHAITLLDKLKVHLIALARLDDPDQLTDEQHMSAAMQTIDELGREI